MAVSHVKSITVADGTNTNIVRPGDWNSVHNQYWTLAGNTAGASTVSGTNVILSGGNNITLSVNGASVGIVGENTSQFLTTAMASNRGSDFVQATAAFAGTSASGTINSTGISVSVGPYITTAMLSNAATISNVRVSAGTTSNLLSAVTFSNSNSVSFGLDGSTITATVSYPAQSNQTVGLYASSNTTLTSSGTFDARSFSVRAIGSLTAGYSAGELILSAPAALTTAMASNRGTDFVQANAVFNGTNASGTIASNAISVSVAAGAATAATLQAWKRHIAWQSNQTGIGTSHGSFHVFPLVPTGDAFQGVMTVGTVGLLMSWSTAATSVSQSLSSTINIGIYTLNGSTLSLLNSAVGTFGNTNDSTKNGSDRWDGLRILTLGSGGNLTWSAAATFSGAAYWVGMNFLSHVTTIAASIPYGGDPIATGWTGVQGNSATNATNHPFFPFHGCYSATTASPPVSITQGDITGFRSDAMRFNPWLEFNNLWVP